MPTSMERRNVRRVPVDGSSQPWGLGLKGDGPVRLCTTR
jgi:hypothetical protein